MTDNSLTAADRLAVAIAETKVARHREQTLAALTNPSEAMRRKVADSIYTAVGGDIAYVNVPPMADAALSAAAAFIKDEQNG